MPSYSPLLPLPVLAQVLLVFCLVVAASAKKVHLGLAALAGGFLFALLRGIPPMRALEAALAELLDPDTLLLLLLVTSIMALSAAMKNSGALAAFSRAVALVAPGPRASLALTPLLIGTLPMPGGAILSAPLVDALDPGRRQGADGLSAANYWFRHALELSWPLYPAFILTSTLSGIAPSRLVALNLYAPFLLIALGQLLVLRPRGRSPAPAENAESRNAPQEKKTLRDLEGFLPLAIVLGVYLALDLLGRSALPGIGLSDRAASLAGRYAPILGGVASGSAWVAFRSRGRRAFRGSVNASTLKLALVIAGIRVFSALLEAGGVAEAGAAELAAWGIPALAAIVVLPFVSGLVTGVGFGYVGLSFPIVLGLFPPGGPFPREAAVVLAGAFGFAGMMLSPLHVCMVVTAEHFGTGLAATIRRFALPLALFLALASAYAALLARVLGG